MNDTDETTIDANTREMLHLKSPEEAPAVAGGSYEEALVDLRGRFEVQRVLQKAIFGTVLLVSPADRPDERLVLKAVSKALADRSVCRDGTQVFEDHGVELRVLGAARDHAHPNLLGLSPDEHQAETAKTRYTALPYLAGGELFEAVQAKGALDEAAARRLAVGIARGLDHLHRKLGFVHNDVSLENVLLSADGEPVVCDFGLASVVGTPWDSRRRISGKLPYQPPEIYFGTARKSSGKGDVFSLGVTLFVLLTGIPPFDLPDPSVDQRYNYIQLGRMAELLELWGKDVPADAVDLLTRMLVHDPSRRISMPEVLRHPWMEAEAAEEAPMSEDELELDLGLGLEGDDCVFDMDMETAGQAAEEEKAPTAERERAARSSAPVATPAKRGPKRHPGATNHTASPDSVFSFEKAYRRHVAGLGGGSSES